MRWSLGLCLLTQLTDFVRLTKSNGRRYENIHKKLKTEKKKKTHCEVNECIPNGSIYPEGTNEKRPKQKLS